MAKFCWDDDFVFYLIEKVRNNEFVWNYKHVMYKNKLKKQQFWLESVKDMNNQFNPVIPFSYGEILKKWNNLKSYFTVENQKLFKAKKSGASIDDVETIESTWKFKSRLNFLSRIADPTPSVNNFNKMSLKVLSSNENILPESCTQIENPSTSQQNSDCYFSFENQLLFEEEEEEETNSSLMPEKKRFNSSQSSHHTFSSPPTSTLKTNFDVHQSPKCPSPSTYYTQEVPKHVKKKPRLTEKKLRNESLATTLLEASQDLTKAIMQQGERASLNKEQKTNTPETLPFGISPFGMVISSEVNKLNDDLQIEDKQKLFSILMDLQEKQLKRNKN